MHSHFCKAIHCPDPHLSSTKAIEENPDNAPLGSGRRKRSVGEVKKLWKPGRTLRIAFVNEPSQAYRDAVKAAASLWLPWVNLTFDFVPGKRGEIKIFTDYDQTYSLIGTDALTVGPSDATMVLGLKLDDPHFEAKVVHEFGHALGMHHEHQHPDADIPWDVPKVYAHFAKEGVSAAEVDQQILNKVDRSLMLASRYDRNSIMHYPVRQELTLGDWSIPQNLKISSKDKAFMRKAYPPA
ncbi:M12 family metallopeptidase [Pseudomonas sp. TE3610]